VFFFSCFLFSKGGLSLESMDYRDFEMRIGREGAIEKLFVPIYLAAPGDN
jgi:hypothetical protein